jgi:DNA invertase Pin-like site-specific DNA recombinase
MEIGYARTSTVEQAAGFDAQKRDLKKAGCTKVFAEQVSSIAERQQLEAALDYLRDGDVLIVTKLDRLCRSMRDLMHIVDRTSAKGAGLRILSMSLDTTTPTGKLMLNVLGSVAEWERETKLERQREGIAKAKAAGKYKGRAKTAMAKADDVVALLAEGVRPTEVVKQLRISRSSVYRVMRERKLKRRQTAYTTLPIPSA